ncbi:putative pre-mRNA-splicing factor ATP-dependent RNA helicase [Toxoplasma gondii CAST]|nr:putative pre-mRNA-splicing factor ATP-dependent RNA helicase [Toxoplasma gondii CAST]
MRRAQDVRKQLITIMDRYKLDVISAGKDYNRIRRCICAGYFRHACRRDPQEGYRTLVDHTQVFLHPSSALYNRHPEWLIYHELVLTTREYLRDCCTIEPQWLVEVAPKLFKLADQQRLSRRKMRERIEPLYDRFAEPNAWRLSKRRG